MDTIVLAVFAVVYLGMLLGEIPGQRARQHDRGRAGAGARVTIGWRRHARVGVPVTLVTLALAAGWLWVRAG